MRLTWRRADRAVCPRVEKGTDCHYIAGEFTQKVYDKLAAYEEAEEQGLLVRLPCKVGDTIYVIHDGKIWDGEVYHISYSDYYGKITATAHVKRGISAAFEHFGTIVFLTREEAEAALKGEKNNEMV